MQRPDGNEIKKTNEWKEEIEQVQINVRFGIYTGSIRLAYFYVRQCL